MVLNRCFLRIFSENWEVVWKNFQLAITHVFYCVLCDNSVLLHKEGWSVVSTLDSLVEIIKRKRKAIKFKRFIQKSSRMHIKNSLVCYKMCRNLKNYEDHEEKFRDLYLKFGSTLSLIIRIIKEKNKNRWHY